MQQYLDDLVKMLKDQTFVHAAWIEGSLGGGHNDELSDIDLWVDVDDNFEKTTYDLIDKFLVDKGGELDIRLEGQLHPPQLRHKTYRLKKSSRFDILEVNLRSHSSDDVFIEGVKKFKVLFDKDRTIKTKPFNKLQHSEELSERKIFLKAEIRLGEILTEKEIIRGHFPEALLMYHHFIADSVVELARIRHTPNKISYGLKDMSRDFPKVQVKELESLYQINNLGAIKDKILEANRLAEKYNS